MNGVIIAGSGKPRKRPPLDQGAIYMQLPKRRPENWKMYFWNAKRKKWKLVVEPYR